MSLDITLTAVRPTTVWEGNITHNLTKMASEVELYLPLWRPEELNIRLAGDLVPYLEHGLHRLTIERDRLLQYNPPNGWGDYTALVEFVGELLQHARLHPDAEIGVSR